MKVLVVDDDRDLVDLIASVLQDAGYLVQTAFNGKEGLDQVTDNPPDLVLLDLHMPVMDGLTFFRLLRQREEAETIPVVLMSADGTRAAPYFGTGRFLSKPFDLDNLLSCVRTNLKE